MACHVAAAVGREPAPQGASDAHSVRDVRAVAEHVTPDQVHADDVVLQLDIASDDRKLKRAAFAAALTLQKQ